MTRPSGRSETETAVVVDVGATRTEAGFGGWKERPEPARVEDTPDTTDELVGTVRRLTDELIEEARSSGCDVSAVAVGVPGLVDKEGTLVDAPHTSFGNLDLSDELDTCVPVAVENDANAQALGCAGNTEDLFYVALGTGIGGAHVVSGEVVRGANGFAGEVGHVPVPASASDRPCACGRRGCLETVASGEYLRETLGDAWWERELHSGERRVVRRAGEAVGEAVSLLAVVNDPETFVVTGSMTTRDEFIAGMNHGWSHPWTDCSLRTYEKTWRFARDGLTKVACRAVDG
ncbi:MAG: ROK family protein [Halobacteriales archaeon]|nr:ROK family protein [Halobacteriales archaeon]